MSPTVSFVTIYALPYALGWEQSGIVPAGDAAAFAQSCIPFGDVPSEFRPADAQALIEMPRSNPGAFHTLIIADEIARIEGV